MRDSIVTYREREEQGRHFIFFTLVFFINYGLVIVHTVLYEWVSNYAVSVRSVLIDWATKIMHVHLLTCPLP